MVQDCHHREIDNWVKHVSRAATKHGCLDIPQQLREQFNLNTRAWGTGTIASTVAQYGRIHILEWIRTVRGTGYLPSRSFILGQAAAKGEMLDVLQCLPANDCPCDEITCSGTAADCHLEVLQWLHANDCPWDAQTCRIAEEGCHF